jgi:hypothetical protein
MGVSQERITGGHTGPQESCGFETLVTNTSQSETSKSWPRKPFAASLVVFVFIVLAARILNIAEWVVNHGVQPSQMVGMVGYLLPGMILFALPAAALMAVFIAFHRLSNDNEILALKASGVSLYQMLPPVVVISTLCFVAALLISLIGAPWGQRSFKDWFSGSRNPRRIWGSRRGSSPTPLAGSPFMSTVFPRKTEPCRMSFSSTGEILRPPTPSWQRRGESFRNPREEHRTPLCGRDDLHLRKKNGGCPDHRV